MGACRPRRLGYRASELVGSTSRSTLLPLAAKQARHLAAQPTPQWSAEGGVSSTGRRPSTWPRTPAPLPSARGGVAPRNNCGLIDSAARNASRLPANNRHGTSRCPSHYQRAAKRARLLVLGFDRHHWRRSCPRRNDPCWRARQLASLGTRARAVTEDDFKEMFPALEDDPAFRISSDFCPGYNCVAFAAGDTTQVWEPMGSAALTPAGTYWPPGVIALSTVGAHIAAFATLGYEPCDSPDYEDGYRKVAIYTTPDGTPVHAARQVAPGVWTSKIGGAEDIEHDAPDRLAGTIYGTPTVWLKRQA